MAHTVLSLAQSMYAAFAKDTRHNGDEFYKLNDDAPQWMKDAVHLAHADMLPDDWRYRAIREACSFLADQSEDADLDDVAAEFADDVDVYDMKLIEWVGSHLSRMGYVDDAMEEYGPKSLATALQMGQATERREVMELLIQALRDRSEELEQEDDGE